MQRRSRASLVRRSARAPAYTNPHLSLSGVPPRCAGRRRKPFHRGVPAGTSCRLRGEWCSANWNTRSYSFFESTFGSSLSPSARGGSDGLSSPSLRSSWSSSARGACTARPSLSSSSSQSFRRWDLRSASAFEFRHDGRRLRSRTGEQILN